MCDLAGTKEVFGKKWMKSHLKDHYQDHLFFANVGGSKKEVVCFVNMASHIVNDQWYAGRASDPETEKVRVLTAAARILKEEIRAADFSRETYPRSEEIGNIEKMAEFVVPSLRLFLDILVNRPLWKVSLGQALIQAARPRSVIAPVLLGVGVEFDHVFGSKWAVSQLHALGFSISPDEVSLFKQSILQDEEQYSLNPPNPSTTTSGPTCFQFAADNADANVGTLDGSGTFHGTGIIRWSKRDQQMVPKPAVVRRARMKVSELAENKGIKILNYVRNATPALSRTKFSPILELQVAYIVNASHYYSTLLWRSAYIVRRSLNPTPDWVNWSGYVQSVMSADRVQLDTVQILPLLDLKSSDENTLLSVIQYVADQVRHCQVPCTTITFDQPLYIKAVEINETIQCKTIVIRLGGFHLLMSAVGSAFSLMKASGIEEAMMEVYGVNVVPQMMCGKAIARALRAINLLDAALHQKLLEFLVPEPHDEHEVRNDDLVERFSETEMVELDKLIMDLDCSNESTFEHETLNLLDSRLTQLKTRLGERYRTAKLWIQFLRHADIIKYFIFSERSKDWEGHLLACTKLLNLFAATGHLHYAKSCRLYVQQMRELPSTQPWLYEMFTSRGLHAVQRANHPMNGLWTDLTIEQVLMASLKSRGGLTHGKGLTKSVRDQWVYTMHQRATVHEAMTRLTGTRRMTSAQHVELGQTRRKRDLDDLERILRWLHDHNPFDTEAPEGLRSISAGFLAKPEVNCDNAEEVGHRIQATLDGLAYQDAKLKRRDQVKTLETSLPGVKIGGEKTIHIDPSTLFLRCVDVSNRLGLPLHEYFKYELCTIPLALFKTGFMLKTEKASLSTRLLALVESDESVAQASSVFVVIDGGWLLHKVVWCRNVTMVHVLQQYVTFVRRKYVRNCTVIFDGYGEANIKDHEHQRRSCGKFCTDVHLRIDTLNKFDQAKFLANEKNKSQFVSILGRYLQEDGHTVISCRGDADTVIAKRALVLAAEGVDVDVVCTDTDVLCLLVYHLHQTQDQAHGNIFFRKDQSVKQKTGGRFSIAGIVERMDSRQANAILFLHAWTGSDTTSALFGHGKLGLLNGIVVSEELNSLAVQMQKDAMTQDEVGSLGEKIFCLQFGQVDSDLVSLRFSRFKKMVAESLTKLDPRVLPPSPRAAHFHSLRVYLQVKRWMQLDDHYMNPLEWGWEDTGSGLTPIMTDAPVGPDDVLSFIRCKCKKLDKRCATNQCTCRRHGLKCVEACGGCHGRDCLNVTRPDLDDGEEDDPA